MKELIQRKQTLKRRRFAHNLTLHIHSGILPMIGAGMMSLFYDINNTLFLNYFCSSESKQPIPSQ